MSNKFTNVEKVPLSLAVFLATDNYQEGISIPDSLKGMPILSATTLLKSTRQIILSQRLPEEEQIIDISQLISSHMGKAIHAGIEHAWKSNYKQALADLGLPERIIKNVAINPTNPTDVDMPVYMEQRAFKLIDGYVITGQFDFVIDGRLEDFKTTSVFSATNPKKEADYIMQGSIYKWLNPEIINADTMCIQFIFTDWSSAKVKIDPNYPKQKFLTKEYPIKEPKETERFLKSKIQEIKFYQDKPESELPLCTDEELWRSEPVWKYYKNPNKLDRSTKNFNNKHDAYIRLAEDGNVGIVKEVPGKAIACKYCSAFPICTQKDALIASGDLEI